MTSCDPADELARWLEHHRGGLESRGVSVTLQSAVLAGTNKAALEFARREPLGLATLWGNGMLELIRWDAQRAEPVAADHECQTTLEVVDLLDRFVIQLTEA